MVALMSFTRDIRRLLGLGGGNAEKLQSEDVEDRDKNCGLSRNVTLSQDGLTEEERARCRAERRKAKRKRQRERQKLKKVKDLQGPLLSAKEEATDVMEQEEIESLEEEVEQTQHDQMIDHGGKPTPLQGRAGGKSSCEPCGMCEEELEWDVSSAFVANAASHIKPKENTKLGHQSRENIENQAGTKQLYDLDCLTKRSTLLTEKGIKLAQEGHYVEAIKMFTEAIKCNPTDYRFFGNRSYCYECLEQYSSALIDAQTSIQLAPKWAKGHFRRGRALIGLKRYKEAAAAMEQVLKLDKDCKEAVTEIQNCKVLQLMERGFDETNSMLLLEKFSTVQAVLTSPEAAKVLSQNILDPSGTPCSSLWVGNVTAELTDKHLWDLFQEFGEIESIRVLHERFCAFVNFKDASMAAQALEKVHGLKVENTKLVVRYPDRRVQRTLVLPSMLAPSGAQQAESAGTRRRGPVNGDECYFWRTTGCLFGDKCRYKHIPEHCGRDRKLPQT